MTRNQLLALQLSLISIAAIIFVVASAHAGGAASDAPGQVGIWNLSTVTSLSTVSAKVVNANADREYLLVQNQGVNSVTIKFNSQQSASEGVVVPAAGSYAPYPVPVGSIWSKSSGGSTTLMVMEGVK